MKDFPIGATQAGASRRGTRFAKLAVYVFCIVLVARGVAAEQLSLDDAISEALHESPRIQKAESQSNEAAWKKVEAYSGFLPSLKASATYLTNTKFMFTDLPFNGMNLSVPNVLPTGDLVFEARLPIFDGFANVSRLRSASASQRAAEADVDWGRFQLQREVSLQFFRALGAQALKDVAIQNLATINDHLKDVNAFKRAGISTSFDVLRVDVQGSEARSELMNSEDNVYIARNKLAELIGRERDDRPLKGNLPELNENILLGKNIEIKTDRADIQALEERSRASTLQSSAANRYWVPNVALIGQLQYYNNLNNRVFDTKAYRDAYFVGVGLNWNLFDGMTSIARSQEAIEQRVQSEKTLQIARLKATQDVEFYKRRFVYFCSEYRSRQSDVQKATESVRLAREGRRAGTRTSTDTLDAESDLFRSRAGAVNAQLGSIEALISLELATGSKLYEFR